MSTVDYSTAFLMSRARLAKWAEDERFESCESLFDEEVMAKSAMRKNGLSRMLLAVIAGVR